MTAEIGHLILEHLKHIRGQLSELNDRVGRLEMHSASLGQQLGALTTAVYSDRSTTDNIRHRVERIEQRLELIDSPTEAH